MSTDAIKYWVREELAALEHQRWSNWQKYLHSKCERHADGSLTIPAAYVANLSTQIETSYSDLTPREKDSDRQEADKTLELLLGILPPHVPEILAAMLEAYAENPRKEYYMTLTPEKLVKMLQQNIAEIELALTFDNDVRGKCADVANYVGFVLRVYDAQKDAEQS